MRLTRERVRTCWPGHAVSSGIALLTLATVTLAAGCGAPPGPSSRGPAAASPARPASPAPAQAAARKNPVTHALSQAGPGWAIAEFSSGSSTAGSAGNNEVAATSGSRMLVLEVSGCTPSGSLAWLDPATGAVQSVLLAPARSYGVMSVVAFNGDGTQPPPART